MFKIDFNFSASGLDISERSLRLIRLTKGKDISLQSYAERRCSKPLFSDGIISDTNYFQSEVKELLKNIQGHKLPDHNVVACLPEPKTFLKIISLPNLELGQSSTDLVINEAKRQLPYDISDVYLDWAPIPKSVENQVLLGACPKVTVDSFEKALQVSGLELIGLEVEPLAIASSLQKIVGQDPCLIVDLGENRSSIIGYHGSLDCVAFSLSLDFSGQKITQKIMNSLSLDDQSAEKVKISTGLTSQTNPDAYNLIKSEVDLLIQQIFAAENYFDNLFKSQIEVKRIYLTGGGSQMISLSNTLKDVLNKDVIAINSFSELTNKNITIPGSSVYSLSSALGLALNGLNSKL